MAVALVYPLVLPDPFPAVPLALVWVGEVAPPATLPPLHTAVQEAGMGEVAVPLALGLIWGTFTRAGPVVDDI